MLRSSAPLLFVLVAACGSPSPEPMTAPGSSGADSTSASLWNADSLIQTQEKHFVHLRRLTFGGNNAEAYWSFNGRLLTFQTDHALWGNACDQIHWFDPMKDDLRAKAPVKLSRGGRSTCSYFLPGDSLVLFASTHAGDTACPPVPEHQPGKYLWPLYASYDMYVTDLHGNIRKRLTETPGYDAEATVSPKGDRIVFTSVRDGDIELYTMNIDGSDVKRVTNELGYDGGAFFSPDGSRLIWRASRPKSKEEVKEYKELLANNLVQPLQMELFIANADGSDAHAITSLGKANWAPSWFHDGKRVIFASNHTTERGFPFTLYSISTDGSGLEQITFDNGFDAFPMFSPDGRYLVFSSNRGGQNHETNLFLAEWKD